MMLRCALKILKRTQNTEYPHEWNWPRFNASTSLSLKRKFSLVSKGFIRGRICSGSGAGACTFLFTQLTEFILMNAIKFSRLISDLCVLSFFSSKNHSLATPVSITKQQQYNHQRYKGCYCCWFGYLLHLLSWRQIHRRSGRYFNNLVVTRRTTT